MDDKSFQKNYLAQFFEAFSLSGAIILLFFSLIFLGIVKNNDKVWQTFSTALTTFVSGKALGKQETGDKVSKLKDMVSNDTK